MKNKYINAIIFILSFALGLVIIIQYNSSSKILNDGVTSEQKISKLRDELQIVKNERDELYSKAFELNHKVREFEDINSENEEKYNELIEELDNYKIVSGVYDVKGPGIVITINDPEQSSMMGFENSNIVSNYTYILAIISNLNSAGAEAISVNEQRYTSYTEIVPVGSNFLNINGKHVVSPIQIKAIGDKRSLDSTVNFVGGVIDQMKMYGYEIDVVQSDDINITGLTNNKVFKYAEPYETENIE